MSTSGSERMSAAMVSDKPFHSFDGGAASELETAAFATLASGRAAGPSGIQKTCEPSVLADFDTGYVLDAVSLGLIVLDKQLCVIYANVVAQDQLLLDLPSLRGQPLAHFLPQLKCFTHAVRGALETGAAVDYTLYFERDNGPERLLSNMVSIRSVCNRMSGAYVLVELNAPTYGRSSKSRVARRHRPRVRNSQSPRV